MCFDKVYLVYSSYYDYCDNRDTLMSVYKDKKEAIAELYKLDNAPHDENTSYYLREEELK